MTETFVTILSILGLIVTVIAPCVGFLWAIYNHPKEVKAIMRKVGKLCDKFIGTIDFPRRILADRMNSEKFLTWQDHILLKIYGKGHFSNLLGLQYPVFCMDFDKDYGVNQVDSICRDDNDDPLLSFTGDGTEIRLPDIYSTEIMTQNVSTESLVKDAELSQKKELMGNGWWWRGYKWFTARSMRDGNHIGFILDHLELDRNNKIKKIHLSVGDYKLNLLTSHILTYEMYKAYENLKKNGYDVDNVDLDTLWPMLPFRRYIHHVNGYDINKVLSTGMGRYALLSVQCLVMLCTGVSHNAPEYKTFILKRSNSTRDVSTKLGCYQFPPSGGFDLYDDESFQDIETIKNNCRPYLALMREYFEEIFNDNSYAKVDKAAAVEAVPTIENVKFDQRTQVIETMLESELAEDTRNCCGFKSGTKQAHFTTIGTNIDLIDLRLSINFLLVVNDIKYYKDNYTKFISNDEFGQGFCKKKQRMLKDWNAVEADLKGQRKIVEDSVALYIQGKKAFDEYIKSIKI